MFLSGNVLGSQLVCLGLPWFDFVMFRSQYGSQEGPYSSEGVQQRAVRCVLGSRKCLYSVYWGAGSVRMVVSGVGVRWRQASDHTIGGIVHTTG